MRWQLLLLFGLAAVSLAYDWEVTDSEESLSALVGDDGKFQSSEAIALLGRNEVEERTKHLKIHFPLVAAAAAVGTLAKVALLVLVATGTIPSPIDNNLPAPIAEAAAVLQDLKEMLTGANTETAIVEINTALSGTITGELFFAQTTAGLSGSSSTLITGTLVGLNADESYQIDVTTNGILGSDCDGAGDPYSETSSGLFVADGSGRALLVVRVENAPLTGSDTVLGRSIVITTEADTTVRVACGVIVRG